MKILRFDHDPTDDEIIAKFPEAVGKRARVFLLKDGTFAIFVFD